MLIKKDLILGDSNQKKLNELLYNEEINGEKRINKIFLLATFFGGITAIINALLSNSFDPKNIGDLTTALVLFIFNIFWFFILKKGIYKPFFKYLTIPIISIIITALLISFSFFSGWVHSLRTAVIYGYFVLIIISGFYQKPSIPIYTSILISIEYSLMFLYAIFFTNTQISDIETFYKPTISYHLLFYTIAIFLMSGIFVSIITKNLRKVIERAIFSEAEAILTEQKSELKTIFFINLAHETKTPLTLINNYLEKYIKKNGISKELEIIKQNIDKLTRDMTNFLDAKKLENNQIFYDNNMITNVSEMLNAKIILFRETGEKNNIKITDDIEDNIYIKIDPYAMDRIINNLLQNAIKYNKINGTVDINLRTKDNNVEFIVKDTGPGISKEQLQKIYELYYQISHEKRNIQGIGMGLYITKNILDALQGKIIVDSELGQGSTFKVILNKYELQLSDKVENFFEFSKPTNDISIKLEKEEYNQNKYNILIVEDNIQMLSYLQESLKGEYNVFYALNGKEALNKFKIIPKPNIIISDIMMDIMDGYEFYEKLLKDEKYNDIPFIFITAKTSKDEKLKGLGKGAIDFINKPFLIEELIAKINSIIRNQISYKNSTINEIEKKIIMTLRNEKILKNDYLDLEIKFKEYNVTEKEKEVLKYIISGKENKEIASELKISINTIKTHIQNIYSKFRVQNKVELINLIYDKTKNYL